MPMPSLLRRPVVQLALALCAVAAVVSLLGKLGSSPSGPGKAVAIEASGGSETFPALSPDGKRLAYSVQRGGKLPGEQEDEAEKPPTPEGYDIYVRDLPKGQPLQITTGGSQFGPAWSPDGASLAFLKLEENGASCMTIPANGGEARRIADCAAPDPERLEPAVAWSADGRALIITAKGGANTGAYLALAPIAGGDPKRLTTPPDGSPGDTTPAPSPDGKLIAFARAAAAEAGSDEARGADIFVCNADGSALRRITFDAKPIHGIAWTADSKEIIYASHRNKSGIFRVGLGGASPKEILVQGRQPRYPTLARTGGRMAYSEMPQSESIWRAPIEEGGMKKAQPVIRSAGRENSPVWSPDGARIATISDQSGAEEIWVANADGGNRVQLTQFNNSGQAARPRWSPDSKNITFERRGQGPSQAMVIPSSGGAPKLLINPPAFGVVISRDGKNIFYERDGRIWTAALDGSNSRSLSDRGCRQPEEGADGKVVYYRCWQGIKSAPVNGGEEKEVLKEEDNITNGPQARGGFIYYATSGRRDAHPVLYRLDLQTGKSVEALSMPGASYRGLSVSPDGKSVLFVVSEMKSNLRVAEQFR